MEIVNGMEIYTLDEVTEERYGPVGTPRRDAFEKRIALMLKRHEVALKGAETRRRNREKKLQLLENLHVMTSAMQAQKAINV